MNKFRFGVAGPGQIAHKFVKDLSDTEEILFVGAASTNVKRAEDFVFENKMIFPNAVAYSSYEEMAKDPNLDAVYISNLNTQHAKTAILFLKNKKPVLCEKPFALNAIEAIEMVRTARENNTFIMEAMWTRFLPVTVRVMDWMNQGRIGDPVRAFTDFGMDLLQDKSHRTLDIKKGGGALLDLGIYPISFFSMIFGTNIRDCKSFVSRTDSGVDCSFDVLFRYPRIERPLGEDYPTAYASVSIDRKMSMQLKIIGTKGYIEMEDFFASKRARLFEQSTEYFFLKEPTEIFETDDKSLGYKYEALEVMQCVQAGKRESNIMTADESVEIMKLLDLLRKDWNLKYPQEE